MSIIEQNLQRVHRQIRTAAQDCGRDPRQITLLAVSKTKPVTAIEAAIDAGQRAFGENYVQEGVEKIGWFRERPEGAGLIWHFIGPLQSNKSRSVAENFDWCHTLDRPQLARRLNDQRPVERAPLNVLIQINISGEATKAGIAPEAMLALAALVTECPRLRLRGLMAIPAPESDFQRMSALYEALQRVHPGVDTLSLGMTDDMPAAIAAGSTLVRIGTAIFGARE
ncbi:YggS family pyridoxal phosphate-dependent enzyme [Candidatus Sodalis sp. SoCistrobi]|uniref:YggS family pyridoxal phosphate-dependent enzyme n=1 Tax=Candidatus Sodalis sp. SoCistrobi TaxID=1922216 RepID=UPI00093F68AA|nr:YggS family pyridoxal phosphate-dependent enzyme [Candidatus Sodalis sp. SoCistrobi]